MKNPPLHKIPKKFQIKPEVINNPRKKEFFMKNEANSDEEECFNLNTSFSQKNR
jgi:hypothetical protein